MKQKIKFIHQVIGFVFQQIDKFVIWKIFTLANYIIRVVLVIGLTFVSPAVFSNSKRQEEGRSPDSYTQTLNAYKSQLHTDYNPEEIGILERGKSVPMQTKFRAGGELWLTLAPDVIIDGPILERNSKEITVQEQEYVKKIFRYLINKANLLARGDHYKSCENLADVLDLEKSAKCKAPLNWTYYSFLVAALTVPFHESYLNHFRKNATDENCNQKVNNLSAITSDRARGFIKNHYRNEENILAPDCRYLSGKDTVQVFAAAKFADVGIMQMNGYYHLGSLEPFNLLSTYNSISRGLEYLYTGDKGTGFNYISQQYNKKYRMCNFKQNPFFKHKGTVARSYYGLIKGSWDQYNAGGSTSRTVCRFVKRPKNSNVKAFKGSLERVAVTDSSLYHSYLPKDSIERKAFNEILYNFRSIFKKGQYREKNYFINQILTEFKKPNYRTYTAADKLNLNFESVKDKASLYSRPFDREKYICKVADIGAPLELSNIGDDGGIVDAIEFDSEIEATSMNLWKRVRFSKYSSHVKEYSRKTVVVGVKRANIRSEHKLVSKCGNCVGQFNKSETGAKELDYLGKDPTGNWFKVRFSKKEAWVYARTGSVELKHYSDPKSQSAECKQAKVFYIKMRDTEVAIESVRDVDFSKGEVAVGIVNGKDNGIANLRSYASGYADLVRTYVKGDSFMITGYTTKKSGSVWYRVRSMEGSTDVFEEGWIWSGAIKLKYVKEN